MSTTIAERRSQRGHGADTALDVYITTDIARRQSAVQELSDWIQ